MEEIKEFEEMKEEVLAVPVKESCFSTRVKNVMRRYFAKDTNWFDGKTISELLQYRNIGAKCIDEILAKQEMYGYKIVEG